MWKGELIFLARTWSKTSLILEVSRYVRSGFLPDKRRHLLNAGLRYPLDGAELPQ